MPSISVPPSPTFSFACDQTRVPDGATGTPKVVRPGRQRSNTYPGAERREIPALIIHRAKRDEKAVELYGSNPRSMPGTASEAALGGIWHQLRTICASQQALEWTPVPGVADTLSALAQYAGRATDAEKDALAATLDIALAAATGHRENDIALFKTAIDRTLRGEDPMEVLGDLAEESLKLDHFSIRGEGLEEPSQKDFDSTLLSFAAGSYDHGPLGRTVLFEGGRARFDGPSQIQRAQKLREIIFALPNPPESGEPLEDMSDIYQALMALGIDI